MLAILPISTTYQIVGLLHVLAAIGAFGPLFLYPRLQRAGETRVMATMHTRVVIPSLVALWVLGMGLAGIGEYDLAETWWMTGSIVVWLAGLAVSWFLVRPAIADRGESARSMLAAGIGSTHLLLVVALFLMVFQPGGSVFK